MVFLDVVYNHFGPEGNFMSLYMPLDSDKHDSDWGKGINFDDEGGGHGPQLPHRQRPLLAERVSF